MFRSVDHGLEQKQYHVNTVIYSNEKGDCNRLKGIRPIWDLVQSTVAAIALVSLLYAQSTACWRGSICSPVWICCNMYQADSNLILFFLSPYFPACPLVETQDLNCLYINGSWRRLYRMPILRSAVQVALDRWWQSFTSNTWSSICVSVNAIICADHTFPALIMSTLA